MTKLRVRREPVVQPPDQSYRIIPLTKKQVTKVDFKLWALLDSRNWYAAWNEATQSFYARTNIRVNGKQKALSMHRYILNLLGQNPAEIDHKNGDTLDNRVENLRPAVRSENMRNRRKQKCNKSGYKGVSVFGDRWRVTIFAEGKKRHLGLFPKDAIIEAALAYDKAAIQYFGEFAHLNFPLAQQKSSPLLGEPLVGFLSDDVESQ